MPSPLHSPLEALPYSCVPPAHRSYGTGYRIRLQHTRAIVDAIHSGELAAAEYTTLPVFGLQVLSSLTPPFCMPSLFPLSLAAAAAGCCVWWLACTLAGEQRQRSAGELSFVLKRCRGANKLAMSA